MTPLVMADTGEENVIRRVGGSPEIKKHLEDMGYGGQRRDGDEHHRRQPDRQGEGVPRGHQQRNGRKDHGLIRK